MVRFPRPSLTVSLALLLAALVVLTQFAAYRVSSDLLSTLVRKREFDKVATISRVTEALLAEASKRVVQAAALQRTSGPMAEAFARSSTPDGTTISKLLDETYTSLKLDILEATDNQGVVIYRAQEPTRKGDRATAWGIDEALAGTTMLTSSNDALGVAVRATEPLRDNQNVVGTITAGLRLDRRYMAGLSRQVGAGLALVSRQGRVWASDEDVLRGLDQGSRDAAFTQKIPVFLYRADIRHTYVYAPVIIVDEAYVILVEQDSEDAYRLLVEGAKALLKWGLIILLMSILFGTILLRMVLRPLRDLRKRAEATAIENTGSPIISAGGDEVTSVVQVLDTLTERMTARNHELASAKVQADAASAAKSSFLANMSHEIRTPLAGVLGMVDLLQTTPLTHEQQRFCRAIAVSSRTLHDLLNNILDLAKIESGKTELRLSDFSPLTAATDIVHALSESASAQGSRLQTQLDASIGMVHGDSTRLRQILFNLIGNAVKFTKRGSITLSIRRLARAEENQVWLAFEVRDTGIGITSADLQTLFRPFVQADNSPTRSYGGTGLGLVICKHFVELMGGTVHIESEPGEGTSVSFEIPFAVAVAPELPVDVPKALPSRIEARVLVAEDNPINQEVIRAMLQHLGATPTIVDNGAMAVEAVKKEHFDLVFMDCQMPVLDGYEATTIIRAGETGRRIPIVALTANAFAEDRTRCLDVGMDDFIAKPATIANLRKTLIQHAVIVPIPALPTLPAEKPQDGVIDQSALDQILELQLPDMPSILNQLIGLYLEDSPRVVTAMADALASGDANGVKRAAHQLKSSSASLGAMRLSNCCLELETLTRSGTLVGAELLFANLQHEYSCSSAALAAMLDTNSDNAGG